MNSEKSTQYKCPECSSAFQTKESFFPFCSERCKLVDLGAWANEEYRIPDRSSQLPEETVLNGNGSKPGFEG